MNSIENLPALQAFILKPRFWAESWSIGLLQKHLNIKLLIFSEDSFARGNINNVPQCGDMFSSIDEPICEICGLLKSELDNLNSLSEERKNLIREQHTEIGISDHSWIEPGASQEDYNPDYYIMVIYSGNHYRLIEYDNTRVFTLKTVPDKIKEKFYKTCKSFRFYDKFKKTKKKDRNNTNNKNNNSAGSANKSNNKSNNKSSNSANKTKKNKALLKKYGYIGPQKIMTIASSLNSTKERFADSVSKDVRNDLEKAMEKCNTSEDKCKGIVVRKKGDLSLRGYSDAKFKVDKKEVEAVYIKNKYRDEMKTSITKAKKGASHKDKFKDIEILHEFR